MRKITLARAHKMLKRLEEEKAVWLRIEATSSTYVAGNNEEPIIPKYDYSEVANLIAKLDEKIFVIKHALHVTQVTEKVLVRSEKMSIDSILIQMAQLNERKLVLEKMSNRLPKVKEECLLTMPGDAGLKYRYINYDLDLIKQEYERVSEMIAEMQTALDKCNQIVVLEEERVCIKNSPRNC